MRLIFAILIVFAARVGATPISDPPYLLAGTGFITDATHPQRPGDLRRIPVALKITLDPGLAEAVIEIQTDPADKSSIDRYYLAHGRIFQRDEQGNEVAPKPVGDLSPALVATLHPDLLASAIERRREDYRQERRRALFAWNDSLWSLTPGSSGHRFRAIERHVVHELFGDGVEKVTFSQSSIAGKPAYRVDVTAFGRELAHIDYQAAAPAQGPLALGPIDRQNDRDRVVAADEIVFTPIAERVYSVDLASLDMRVIVAEFADFLMVMEGAYSASVCDRIAHAARERFAKPVRYFAFSHLHGQYVGGARSWVAVGATVLVPPTTEPLIRTLITARHELQPDALSRTAKPLKLETVARSRRIEDAGNAIDIYNVESSHTDEYFIFHFPRQKVLLTGDLLGYRPGSPLRPRARKLCETVRSLGLSVDTYVATWPLHSYGVQSIVDGRDVAAACAAP